jgi:site-specific recombinase XerC
MLQRNARDLAPRRVARSVGAYLDFLRFDFQKTRMTLDDFRRRLTANGIPA